MFSGESAAITIETLSVFEEAIQMATRFLGLPIAMVGLFQGGDLTLKATVGLSHLGFMNPLARRRKLPQADPLVMDTCQQAHYLTLDEALEAPPYRHAELVEHYGIRSYGGVPLRTTTGQCIGLLMVMGTEPRQWGDQEVSFLEMTGRWAMSEYERHQLMQKLVAEVHPSEPPAVATTESTPPSFLTQVRLDLIDQLTQELRSPLTSITGIAGMLTREIYGPLTPKQQEYAEVIHSSSQRLLETVDEIIALSSLGDYLEPLTLTTIDIDMVGQQVAKALTSLAETQQQTLQITVEPGSRLWLLDGTCVKQLIYHLLACTLSLGVEGVTVRLHASRRDSALNLAVWISNPWLGEGLPTSVMAFQPYLSQQPVLTPGQRPDPSHGVRVEADVTPTLGDINATPAELGRLRGVLALTLARHLAERMGGTLTLQGNVEAGYRFVASVPAEHSPVVES